MIDNIDPPYEEYDDTRCFHCEGLLDKKDINDYSGNGFCSEKCEQDNINQIAYTLPTSRKIAELLCHELCVNIDSGELERKWARSLYKATNCGAWVAVKPHHIIIGSIVEGCDFDANSIELHEPITAKQLGEAIEDLEADCDYIWQQTHGCSDCGYEGEWGHPAINPNCKSCKGQGQII